MPAIRQLEQRIAIPAIRPQFFKVAQVAHYLGFLQRWFTTQPLTLLQLEAVYPVTTAQRQLVWLQIRDIFLLVQLAVLNATRYMMERVPSISVRLQHRP
jgi:uncharacterized membrane protein